MVGSKESRAIRHVSERHNIPKSLTMVAHCVTHQVTFRSRLVPCYSSSVQFATLRRKVTA